MIIVNINPGETYTRVAGLWQYDYGQVLRIQGLSLPPAIEIHFSLQETGGEAITRIGVTRDGVTDVVIPDSILDGAGAIEDYFAYAFIYPSDENSGQTEHRIEIGVKSRPKPEGYKGSGDDTMGAVMNAINEIAAGKADGLEYKNSILRLMSGETELAQVTISGGSGGENGITPHIGENGNWYLGEADTGVKAAGSDGITPHIGDNGNWYIGETDTGVKAEAPSIDSTLTESGKAADAKITGEKISELKIDLSQLSEEKVDKTGITLGKHTDGLIYVFVDGLPVGNGFTFGGGEITPEETPTLFSVNWLDTAYGIGDNTVADYNAWAPNCSHYDADVGKVMFLQCHAPHHTGSPSDSQLWAINPYNVMECELVATFPPVNGKVPLTFDIYKGDYYIVSPNKLYKSTDKGVTWTSKDISLPTAYGLYVIDDVMYVGDDSSNTSKNGVYYTSNDFGITWETKRFDFTDTYGDELFCSEAVFCKHNGKLYASIRRQDKKGLLAHLNNGVWEVLSEELPNVNSDCSLYSVKDTFVFCAIDRPALTLYLGTISDTDFAVNIEKTLDFSKNTKSGDFHTPSYVYGDDFQMVTFMIGATAVEYATAMNVALVGYDDMSKNKNISYNVTKNSVSMGDVTETPYIGTPIGINATRDNFSVTAGSVVNSKVRLMGTGKIIDNNFHRFTPIYSENAGTAGAFNQNAFGYVGYDWVEHNGKYYSCFVKPAGGIKYGEGFKIMTKAKPQMKVENVSEKIVTGENTEFVYPIYVSSSIGSAVAYLGYACSLSVAEPSVLT